MPDPDHNKEPPQPDPSGGEQSPEGILEGFRDALDEKLPTFRAREEERDLATLDDAGIATEQKREEVRAFRQSRRVSREEADDAKDSRKLDRRQRIILIGLLPFAAVIATAVVLTGLIEGEAHLVQAGLAALCAVCGGALYQLRSLARPPDAPPS